MSNSVEFISGKLGRDPENAEFCGWTKPGWYFYDETWTQLYGPYLTKEIAETKLSQYCAHLNGLAH